jgi:hypothetical protein
MSRMSSGTIGSMGVWPGDARTFRNHPNNGTRGPRLETCAGGRRRLASKPLGKPPWANSRQLLAGPMSLTKAWGDLRQNRLGCCLALRNEGSSPIVKVVPRDRHRESLA